MLKLINVQNSTISEIKDIDFEVGIFASGYESRATFVAREIGLDRILHTLVLGFNEFEDNTVRKDNDLFYKEHNTNIVLISSAEEKRIYNELISIFTKLDDIEYIRVLVDYTSMSRLWYSGILNFLRFQPKKNIQIYLTYSIGKYEKKKLLDYTYSEISSLPSHEGSLSANVRTLLVLGVGYSPYLVKAVIEDIEPNSTLGIVASSSDPKYLPNNMDEIRAILDGDINDWVQCPIQDLEYIFRTYAEIVSNNLHERDILFLSLGPKIFTVASILVSQRFEYVTCLYLKQPRNPPIDIQPIGQIVCTQILYSHSEVDTEY
jgi:hypothetical protein